MLKCDLAGALAAMKRIRRWVLARYTLAAGASGDAVRLKVDGDFGIAEWSAGESAEQIVERAQANKDEPATAKVCGAEKSAICYSIKHIGKRVLPLADSF